MKLELSITEWVGLGLVEGTRKGFERNGVHTEEWKVLRVGPECQVTEGQGLKKSESQPEGLVFHGAS